MADKNPFQSMLVTGITGRNGFDPPIGVPADQCVEALNVDWWAATGLANKRGGATAISLAFSVGGPFTRELSSILRYVPDNDETVAELWAVDANFVVGRLAGGLTWVAPAMQDAVQLATEVTGVALKQQFFLAYKSGQNRLHCWDPLTNNVRRVGLATPATPTTTNMGAGGLSFTRYYRVRWEDINGSETKRRSEPSVATGAVTISGLLGVTVNRPIRPGENETHFVVEYAAAAAGPWYVASRTDATLTSVNDTDAAINTTTLTAATGINTPPPAWKWMVADDNRLVGTGCFETAGGFTPPKNNRVWWTPVLGSTDVGDSERVVANALLGNGYLDVETATTGIGGPLQGAIYVFGYRRIWRLVPTGLASAPYQRFTVTNAVGCIRHQSIVMGEDERGIPCLYFWSQKGPYRIGAEGLQYLGRDIEDISSTINLATSICVSGVYHAEKHQVWYFIATGSNTSPDTRLVFDTTLGQATPGNLIRKGWARHSGEGAKAQSVCLFSTTPGAVMSRDLKPHIGQWAASAPRLWKCDSAATDDAGTAFQAYVDTREMGGVGANHAVDEGTLIAQASAVSINVTVRSDFAQASSAPATISLAPSGTEPRVQKRLEGLYFAGVGTFALRIGDAAAIANQWAVDAVQVQVMEQELRG